MRRDEFLKQKEQGSERIIPMDILPEFKRVLNILGFQTDKLLDENDDWYVKEYDVPTQKDYPYPEEKDLQLSRDMARRDNAFLRKITKYGEEYCNGFFNFEENRYMNFNEIGKVAMEYLVNFEKYDYAVVTPIWEKNENWFRKLFMGKESFKGYNYHYCQWSVWLQKRVFYFMQKSEALNILDNMKCYFNNYTEAERKERGWKTFEDYASEMAVRSPMKEPSRKEPAPYDVFKKEEILFNHLRLPSSVQDAKDKLSFDATLQDATVDLQKSSGEFCGFIFIVKGSVLWRYTLQTKEDVREELMKYIKREQQQPCIECQSFFRLSEEIQSYIIENLVEVIYKEQVDVDYVFPLWELHYKLDEFRQEGAELRGGMHALA